jgi:hypothetical protein
MLPYIRANHTRTPGLPDVILSTRPNRRAILRDRHATPFIDLDAVERNLDAMAYAVGKLGVRLWPHAKTHKSLVIAAKQIARGAVGMCCQPVGRIEPKA